MVGPDSLMKEGVVSQKLAQPHAPHGQTWTDDNGVIHVVGELEDGFTVTGESATVRLVNADFDRLGIGDPTILMQKVDVNITATGHNAFRLANQIFVGSSDVNVDLVGNSQWVGGFSLAGTGPHSPCSQHLTVTGGPHATFVNTGVSFGAYATFDVDVGGSGSINLSWYGRMEFCQSVGSGLSVNLADSAYLQIDKPNEFDATVLGGGRNTIDLKGLADSADSYSYQNDMLSIYHGCKVIDTLRLESSSAISVWEGNGDVMIGGANMGTSHPSWMPLSLHDLHA